MARKKLLDKRHRGALLYMKVGELVVVDGLKGVLPMEARQDVYEEDRDVVDPYWDDADEAEDAEI